MSTTTTTHATHVNAEPLTTAITEAAQPGLLRSHVDERISRIRPSSTPLDQISRMVGARKAGSMKVEYYSVDTKPGEVQCSKAIAAQTLGYGETFSINVKESGIIAPSETLLIPGTTVKAGDKESALVCYVSEVSKNEITVYPILTEGTASAQVGAIPVDASLVRMGRAAGELDVQTDQYAVIPTKNYNFCQIFKAQVEESLLQRLSDKEVGWSFSDQEESAIVDMRLGMEKSFLFGERSRLSLMSGTDVLLTGGIWNQAGKEHVYNKGALDEDTLNDILRKAFTLGAGSDRKVLLAGSGLISALSRLDKVRVVSDTAKKVVWGIDFDSITSKFGTVYVKLSEIFDLCGMPDNGIIIDPEYITKYSHIPFTAERISFRKQGVRNTEGVVLTEASCLVLRYPDSHMRVVCKG
ncbi:MAG: DUF5309 domain-containing protein [Muribaculaceae bacterium]|nr:DUF5309 domain-containing protein [Muribaculaceae bacterium]